MYRYRRNAKKYDAHTATVCPFCEVADWQLVEETADALIVRNHYPYDIWEFRKVTDHLMVVPRRHASSLSELSKEQRSAIMEYIAQYEKRGYNIYSRSHRSLLKSVPKHQHTHLIATEPHRAKIVLYLRKPYWLFRR